MRQDRGGRPAQSWRPATDPVEPDIADTARVGHICLG